MSKYEFEETELNIDGKKLDEKTQNDKLKEDNFNSTDAYNADNWTIDKKSVKEYQEKLTEINLDSESENKIKEEQASNEEDLFSAKKLARVIVAIICLFLFVPTLISFFDKENQQDITTTNNAAISPIVTTTEYIKPDYWEGKCGDSANYTIYNASEDAENPYYILSIEGNGALWNPEDIDWQIDGGKINEIWVYDGITEIQENQFLNGTFDNVIEIHFFDTVNYIGKSACAGIETLEKVYVDSMECDIVYIDDEGYLYNTLGNTESGVTIVCYEDSTAEEYVNTWNDNYKDSYSLVLY